MAHNNVKERTKANGFNFYEKEREVMVDNIALYNCLQETTSESEFSCDELTLPKVSEVYDIEKLPEKYSTNNFERTPQPVEFVCNKRIKENDNERKNYLRQKRGTNVNFTNDTGIPGNIDSENSNFVIGEENKQNSKRTNTVTSSDESDDHDKDYEASEDCSDDSDDDMSISSVKRRKTSESSISVHVCPFEGCQKEFNRPSKLDEHIRKHKGERPFKCKVEGCGHTYQRKQHLQRHQIKSHTAIDPKEYLQCDVCKMMFKNKYNLSRHHYRAHVRENFNCPECGKYFRKLSHLRTHSFVHTGVQPYLCQYPGCNKGFLNPSRLKRHAIIHAKGRYVCSNEFCNKKFDKFTDLQKHCSAEHPKVCDICNKQYKMLRKLKMHRKTHEDVREAFFCPFANCDRHYYEEKNLAKHIRELHEKTMIYECGICDLRLASKQKLAHHVTTHYGPYTRNYASKKPRNPRKDKGVSRTDYARLLSGYSGEEPPKYSPEQENMILSEVDKTFINNNDSSFKAKVSTHESDIDLEKNSSSENEADMSKLSISNHENIQNTISETASIQSYCNLLSEDDMERLMLSSD